MNVGLIIMFGVEKLEHPPMKDTKPPVVQVTEKTMLHMVIRRYAWLSSHLHPLAITHRVAHPHAGKPFVKGGAAQL